MTARVRVTVFAVGMCVCVWFTENQVAIAAAGGIERVVSAMAGHAGSAGVQERGCGALWSLAVNAGTWLWYMVCGIGVECVAEWAWRDAQCGGWPRAECCARVCEAVCMTARVRVTVFAVGMCGCVVHRELRGDRSGRRH